MKLRANKVWPSCQFDMDSGWCFSRCCWLRKCRLCPREDRRWLAFTGQMVMAADVDLSSPCLYSPSRHLFPRWVSDSSSQCPPVPKGTAPWSLPITPKLMAWPAGFTRLPQTASCFYTGVGGWGWGVGTRKRFLCHCRQLPVSSPVVFRMY